MTPFAGLCTAILVALSVASPATAAPQADSRAAPLPKPIRYAKPRLIAAGFDEPRIPIIADVDGDGFADIVAAYPPDPGIVDVAWNVRGQKFLWPVQAATNLGPIVAVTARPGAKRRSDIVLTLKDRSLRVISYGDDKQFHLIAEGDPATRPESVPTSASRPLIADLATRPGPRPGPADIPMLGDLPPESVVTHGDVSGDGKPDAVIFRRSGAWRVGHDVFLCVAYQDGDADCDGDGLDAATEARLGSDPLDGDTDKDGLPDGWEVNGEAGIDLAAFGASPTHADVFVFCQRFEDADGAHIGREMARCVKTWSELPNANVDGRNGINLHPIWLAPLSKTQAGSPWWDLGNANLPAAAHGIAHYMVAYNGGGGQASELGECGSCGAHAFWPTFLHEFGHELGLSHEGGAGLPGMCPTYTSLMNYAYSYGFNDDGNQIHYSHGELKDLVLNEQHLDEHLRMPFEKLAFLAKGPFRFKVAKDGEGTMVDWNRNGVFDDVPVRADITDVYGANGGERFPSGKSVFGPTLLTVGDDLFVFGVTRDRKLFWRRCESDGKWTPESWLPSVTPTGDLWSVTDARGVTLFVPSETGLMILRAPEVAALGAAKPEAVPDSKGAAVSAVVAHGHTWVLVFTGPEAPIRILRTGDDGRFVPHGDLGDLRSMMVPGVALDPDNGDLAVGWGESIRDGKADRRRWKVSRFHEPDANTATTRPYLALRSSRTVGGDKAGWYGDSRPVLVFDPSTRIGGASRLHFIGRGFGGAPNANVCFFEAITIGDASQDDGWRLRRFYDEWTTTRSPLGATWHKNDLVLAFRWAGNVHGDEDDNLLISHHGLGIDAIDMHDYDDVTAITTVGLSHSILWRNPAAR